MIGVDEIPFLSTLSLRRATRLGLLGWLRTLISIHALLAESDIYTHPVGVLITISIHALLAESDWDLMGDLSYDRNFYPRSPCGERPCHKYDSQEHQSISIHALLAESDWLLISILTSRKYFYPRSPCGERRKASQIAYRHYNISIHALLAESDQGDLFQCLDAKISIHALLAESD